MKEIEKTGIVIIQWLEAKDYPLGEELYTKIKTKETLDGKYFVNT